MPATPLATMPTPEFFERIFAPDFDPDGIGATAPTSRPSGERALLVTLLLDGIRYARGFQSSTDGRVTTRRRLCEEGLRWFLRTDGVDEWGSCAFICAALDLDQADLIAAFQRNPWALTLDVSHRPRVRGVRRISERRRSEAVSA